jgi:asparagine synthetase B (glutamine-hydrolysing)
MCGIAGVFNLNGAAVAPESLRGMIRMLAHRGPDGTGFHAENGMGMAHALSLGNSRRHSVAAGLLAAIICASKETQPNTAARTV